MVGCQAVAHVVETHEENKLEKKLENYASTYLHCLAKVFSFAFLRNYRLVNFTCSDVMIASECRINEAFIVAQVKVSFTTVVENKHLAVLER